MVKKEKGFWLIGAVVIAGVAFVFLSFRTQPQFALQAAPKSLVQAEQIDMSQKARIPGEVLQFEVVSDIHVQARDEFAQDRFRLVLQDLAQALPGRTDALIVNGDLGDGKPEDYNALHRVITEAKAKADYPPFLFNIGNHEYYKAFHDPLTQAWNADGFPNGESDSQAIERYLALTGERHVYYERVIQGYHFLFLGSEKSRMSDPTLGDAAYLSNQQIEWLKVKLKEGYVRNKPMFVFLHQPLFTSAGWGKTRFVIQEEELRKLFQAYPGIILFSGHLHTQLGLANTILTDGFTQLIDSSPARTRDADFKISTEKSEGLVVQVFGDRVVVKGRDFLHHSFVPRVEYMLKAP